MKAVGRLRSAQVLQEAPSSQPSCHPDLPGFPLPPGRAQTLPDKARSNWRVRGEGHSAWLAEGHRQSPGQVGVTETTSAPRTFLEQLRRLLAQLETAKSWP